MSLTSLAERAENVKIPMGDHVLRFELTDFGKMYEDKARNELREIPEVVEESMKQLIKYIKEEPGLEIGTEKEELIMAFLRPCKHYPESAMEKIRKYYKFKAKHPKYYDQLLPSLEKAAFFQSLLTVLPKRTNEGERILIVEAGRKWNPKSCSLTNLVRAVILILEAALLEARTQVSGAQVILDMDGLSMQHVWQFGPGIARDIVEFVQECVPIRLKGVHIVNQPYVFNVLFAIFKPFLGEKLRRRIHFHGSNFSSLHDALGQDVLPMCYDGELFIPKDQGEQLHHFLMNFEGDFKVKTHEGYTNGRK